MTHKPTAPGSSLSEAALEASCRMAGISADLVKLTWNTVASAARDANDLMLFLMYCKNNGLNPLKGEAFFSLRYDKELGDRSDPRAYKPVMITSYHVFVKRLLAAGYHVDSSAVCEKDSFRFDRGALKIEHSFGIERGRVVGAWALVKTKAEGRPIVGMYLPIGEMAQPTGTWASMPHTMAQKTVVERTARYACQELANQYGPEEMTGEDTDTLAKEAKLSVARAQTEKKSVLESVSEAIAIAPGSPLDESSMDAPGVVPGFEVDEPVVDEEAIQTEAVPREHLIESIRAKTEHASQTVAAMAKKACLAKLKKHGVARVSELSDTDLYDLWNTLEERTDEILAKSNPPEQG